MLSVNLDNDVVWAVHICIIVSQQSEQQWTEHKALGDPSPQCDGVCEGDAVPNPDRLMSLSQEVRDLI